MNNNKKIALFSVVGVIVLAGIVFGYFMLSGNTPKNETAGIGVSVSSVKKINQVASVSGAISFVREIKWNSSSYPNNVGVDINLLKKVSDSPLSYVLVKNLFVNTPNDGFEQLTSEDLGNDLYIEVVCSKEFSFIDGCVAGLPVKLD